MHALLAFIAITSSSGFGDTHFWVDGRTLMCGQKVVSAPDKGDVFVSRNSRYAAVYNQTSRKVHLLVAPGEIKGIVDAINPMIRIDDYGNFAIFEPELSRFRIVSVFGQEILRFQPPNASYTDEAYVAFDVNRKYAVLALHQNGHTFLKMWKLGVTSPIIDTVFEDRSLYPARAWVYPDGTLIFKVYMVESGMFVRDGLLFYSIWHKMPGELALHGIRHATKTDGQVFLASKNIVYRVDVSDVTPRKVDSIIVQNLILDIKADSDGCWILSAVPKWEGRGYSWENPELSLWAGDVVRSVAFHSGKVRAVSLVEVDGKVGLWLPAENMILKQED